MELIERDDFLNLLQTKFESVSNGEGHCILLCGEAGIGKTSLLKNFCREHKGKGKIYQGICDALFTPRPLAPVYDIIWQMHRDSGEDSFDMTDRAALFGYILHKLEEQEGTTLVILEDIHCADEATFDFIKFLARRIGRLSCLFIVTYRDNEIHAGHPLRNVLGQLPLDSFTKMRLTSLSKAAVEELALEKGYKGEDVYSISGGNPFYVNEILASYSIGIPDNIKDSILSSYDRLDARTKHVWQILSILPTGCEVKYLERLEPQYAAAIHSGIELGILIPKNGLLSFKHELFRRAVESSLSPLVRMELNQRILDLFTENFEQDNQLERIIHHAKNSNQNDLVVKYAPLAAKQAAGLGAHIEASKLYLSAIEYYQGNDKDTLIRFYDSYAYECYLTNQIREAIIYTERSLQILKEKNDIEKTGSCMRFLSRLWWFNGNSKKAESYANNAIGVLSDQPDSKAKGMAFSNMSQLKMLFDQRAECIAWGERAIAIAKKLHDDETLCHALNNVGTVRMRVHSSRQEGIGMLQQSLDIALRNSFHEHGARAYTNLGSNAVEMKDFLFGKKVLEEGIKYCEERDLDSLAFYLATYKSRLNLETGNWDEAYCTTSNLIKNVDTPVIVRTGALVIVATIMMRRGETDVMPLLSEAREKAFAIGELQRILPVITALLEYEWISEMQVIEQKDIDHVIKMIEHTGNIYENSEFAFWLFKARKQTVILREFFEGYRVANQKKAKETAALWKQIGSPYNRSLALFEGDENNKREAISIIHKLEARAVYEKMKQQMRASGIKSIPRGIRKTTRTNPAHLTERELEVLQLLKESLQNKEIANKLFISPKTVDHHISSILFKLDVNSRTKAVKEAILLEIIK
jgi:DNA-binding CsgD family transcriptional regulator